MWITFSQNSKDYKVVSCGGALKKKMLNMDTLESISLCITDETGDNCGISFSSAYDRIAAIEAPRDIAYFIYDRINTKLLFDASAADIDNILMEYHSRYHTKDNPNGYLDSGDAD